jgi:2-octaprenyl-6-methoxyphenol hydroxylase
MTARSATAFPPFDAAADADIVADTVIVGGGMAGMSMGLALASAGITSVIVDPVPAGAMTAPPFDGRVSALAHCATQMYRALDLWPLMEPQAQPINEIRVSDGASPRFLHFDASEIGDAPFGHIVENRHTRIALLNRLGAVPEVTLLAPETLAGLEVDAAGVVARLASGRQVRAHLAIGADGRHSLVRELSRIRAVTWRYGQVGIVTTVEHELDHHGIAHERFLPAGPFAVLPMTGKRSSLVWTEPEHLAPALMRLDDERFGEEMHKRFGDFLGATRADGPRWSYPLGFHHAERYIAPRVALIGDAAHGIHPIAGQGLNLGLKDVAALAEVLADAKGLGLDMGSATVLERYENWRRVDNTVLAVATDSLNRLFSNDIMPLRLARSWGLGDVNHIGPARRFFMRHARGTVGDLPRLMTGERL